MLTNFPEREAGLEAAGTMPDRQAWVRFFDRLFLFLGSALVLAGVIYYFAYNWAKMHKFLKFGLIEGAILAAVFLALHKGLSTVVGKVLLLSAAVLVGPLLAVYGQVYQTGADSFGLFLTWAVLVAAWVIFGAFGPLWLLLLTLLNVSLILYWIQILNIRPGWDEFVMFPVLAMMNIAAWFAWEEGDRKGVQWLSVSWYPRIIAGVAICYLTIYSFIAILDERNVHLAAYLLLGGIILIFACFRYRDLPVLAACMLSVVAAVTTLAVKIFEPEDPWVFGLIGLLVAGMTAGASAWLLSVKRKWEGSEKTKHTPWYIQTVIGVGAWLAAIMFLIFFVGTAASASRASGTVFIVQGVFLCAGQVMIFRWRPHRLFPAQFALAIGLAGQLLFAFGVGERTDELAAAAFALAILELVLAGICRNRIQIFLSVLIASVALTLAVWDLEVYDAVNALVILLAVCLMVFRLHPSMSGKETFRTAGYGAAASLFTVLVLSILTPLNLDGMKEAAIHWWLSTAALLLLLLVLEHMTARPLDVKPPSPAALMLIGGTVLLSIMCWQSPGILAVLLVLGLGYHRGDRILSGMAMVFLPIFLTAYYYHMDLTLLQKSAALAGPGTALLVFRMIMRRGFIPAEAASGRGAERA